MSRITVTVNMTDWNRWRLLRARLHLVWVALTARVFTITGEVEE